MVGACTFYEITNNLYENHHIKKKNRPFTLKGNKLIFSLRFSFVYKLFILSYYLIDLLTYNIFGLSMTINGWEMMIPLAFFAGTG